MQKVDGKVQRIKDFHYHSLKMEEYKRDVKPPGPFILP